MEEALSPIHRTILNYMARVRGSRVEAALMCLSLAKPMTVDALRKVFDRLVARGLLAKSHVPGGSQMYRLSRKGAQLIGAPSSYADAPTAAIASEATATSACARHKDDFVFLTRQEFLELGSKMAPGFQMERFPGRFVLRCSNPGEPPTGTPSETHLHFFLAEFKPAEQLAARVDAIINALTKTSPLFSKLIQRGLFGVSIVVPSEGVAQTLRLKTFPVTVSIVVVPELAAMAGKTA